jgi:hypothetical protein
MKRLFLASKFRSHSIIAVGLLFLAGACGPSINQAAKADIDRRVAAFSTSSQGFSAPTAFEPMPVAVGQWTEYWVTNDKGESSFMRMKVVGESAGAHWFEIESQTYYGKSAMLYLMSFGDRKNIDTIEIKTVRQMDNDGKVQEFPPELIGMMQSIYKKNLGVLIISWENKPQEDASSPAGKFSSCYKVKSDVSIMGYNSSSMSWSHPSIPLSGMVKSEGIDNKNTMVLTAFGTSGAKSIFPGM